MNRILCIVTTLTAFLLLSSSLCAGEAAKVPPKKVPLPEAVKAELESGLSALGKDIEALKVELKSKPALLELLPDVQIFHNAVRFAIEDDMFYENPKSKKIGEIDTAKKLLRMNVSIDLGLAQINIANLARLGLSVEQAFEPCANLHAAETVLRWCYDPAAKRLGSGQPALQAALSCYNTGGYAHGLANGYVQGIYRVAKATQ